MNTVTLSVIVLILMLVAIFCKMWIGTAMAAFGLIGIAIIGGVKPMLIEAGLEPFATISQYTFTCIPLFLLMGTLIANTGLGNDLFDFAAKMIGHIRGGLAMATTVACGIFAAVSGSSIATAVTMGRLAYPEMRRYNYGVGLSSAVIATSGTIGFMIPPSIAFIIYGLMSETSIGKLFMAGILPGVLNVVVYCIVVYIISRVNPNAGPAGPRYKFKERVASVKGTFPILILLLIVLGGIYLGICTTTEAGALGAAGALIVAAIMRKLNWSNLKQSVMESVSTTGMFVTMIFGSYIFMRFLTLSGIPTSIRTTVESMNISGVWILVFIIIFYLIAGAVFDAMPAVVLTLPITMPLVTAAGYDQIWFGVLLVKLIMIGQFTPPIGMNVFICSSALKVPTWTIFKGALPFLVSDVVQLTLLVAFPAYPLLLVR